MLELFKPLQILKDKDNPVLFSELGVRITDKYGNEKGLRPFVIFYDDKNHQYWYLRARDAKILKTVDDGRGGECKKWFYKKPYQAEMLIEGTGKANSLFYKDSYVDCSQIFKIDAELLESLVDTNCEHYKNTDQLPKYVIWDLLDKVNECCNEVPPYLSILEVKLDSNDKTYAESLYLSEEKRQDLIKLDEMGVIDFYYDYDDLKIDSFYSNPTSSYGKQRFDNAIEFVEDFQYQYFKDEWSNTNYQERYYEPFEKSKEKGYERQEKR